MLTVSFRIVAAASFLSKAGQLIVAHAGDSPVALAK